MEERTGTFAASDGLSLFYRWMAAASPAAAVLIVHGYAEHSGRYRWVMENLASLGFAAFAPDLRGHGRSVARAGTLADLDKADRIPDDLHRMRALIQENLASVPVFVLGHSLGCCLSALYILRYPQDAAGFILSGPALTIPEYASPFLLRLVGLMARLFPLLPMQEFDYHQVSRDPQVIRALEEDPLYYKGKVRARTGYEMLRCLREAGERLEEISLPLLILQGGEDRLVNRKDAALVHRRASSADKTLHVFPGLFHEILNEPEKREVLDFIVDWLRRHLA